jgi:hypothetical protein
MGNLVSVDEAASVCTYYIDPSSGVIRKTEIGGTYDSTHLRCMTPNGLIPLSGLSPMDGRIDGSVVRMNPANVKQLGFQLTQPAPRDHEKSVVVHGITIPFLQSMQTVPFYIYVPETQRDVVIPMTYHTSMIKVSLPIIAASQLPILIPIDPTAMTLQFASDLRNVNLYANLQLPECPGEQMVYARVNFGDITEPICRALDEMFERTQHVPLTVGPDADDVAIAAATAAIHVRVPYLYKINMRNMTCQKSFMHAHDLGIPLMPVDEFNALNIEAELMRYTMFQMMFTHRKIGHQAFLEIQEDYMILFDFYLRRDQEQHVYHYDLTAAFPVSSVALLYSIPPGQVKVGPHVIPLKYRTNVEFPHLQGTVVDQVVPVTPFVTRNSVAMFNNVVLSHSTPNVEEFLRRGQHQSVYEIHEVQGPERLLSYQGHVRVEHPEMEVPQSIVDRLAESRQSARTFLRSWHVLGVSESQQRNQEPFVDVFENFATFADHCIRQSGVWLQQSPCDCVQVFFNTEGETILPQKTPGHMGGKVASTSHVKTNLQVKRVSPLSKSSRSSGAILSRTRTIRASTISNAREYIRTKLKKLKTVFENPTKNVIVTISTQKSRTRSHTRSHSQSRTSSNNKHNRTVKSRASI